MPKLHPPRDQRFSTTLVHGLQLLCSFEVGEVALGNRQFAERTGLSKATVSRLTYTLAALGYLKFDLDLRRYRLGAAALSVSFPLLSSLRIRQLAQPLMRALADSVGGAVSIGMRDRTQMVYLETSRGHSALTFRPDIGASLSLLRSAMGRAWVAQAAPAQARALRAQIRTADPVAWKTFGRRFDASLRGFAHTGFCVSHGDWRAEIHAVAAPMRVAVDGEILVFNCGVPTLRLAGQPIESAVGPLLVDLVRRVEAALADAR